MSDNINVKMYDSFVVKEKILTGSESPFGHTMKKEFKDTISQIGQKLLNHEGKSDAKIESCKLGYSNAEAMVIFPYNIPTMTITALWCKGVVDGDPWLPLAERRRRTKEGKYLGED